MGWRDRDYNRGAEAAREFFSNPASILSLAVPLGRWFGARVTLHFWFLLTALFIFIRQSADARNPGGAGIACALLFLVALGHEFSHRFFARRVGGHHEEFVIWPFGGMSTPATPPRPSSMFWGAVGGILFNFALWVAITLAILIVSHESLGYALFYPLQLVFNAYSRLLGPLFVIRGLFCFPNLVVVDPARSDLLLRILAQISVYSIGMLAINLLPYAWFDGGNLWQSILWRFTSAQRAIRVTCMAGMIIAVPIFFIELYYTDFFGMILWILLFSSSYVRWRAAKSLVGDELGGEFDYGYAVGQGPPPRRRHVRKGWFRSAKRRAEREAAEQAKIDAILAKVHDKGLHSLTWWEKRTLRKATERQRQRDLAEKM